MKKTSLRSSRAWSAPASGSARLIEGLRTSTFRTVVGAGAAFTAVTLCLFLFVYWQTSVFETARIDRSILNEIRIFSNEKPDFARQDIAAQFAEDLDRLTFAALFGKDGRLIAGGIAAQPKALPVDGRVHETELTRQTRAGLRTEPVRAAAKALPDGNILVVGRNVQDLRNLRAVTRHAMWFGVLPALLASLGIGLAASLRTTARVAGMNRAIARIMEGHLQDRLPASGTQDVLDQLALSCNRMLDVIEQLVDEMKGVGDNIAHDLRTPLARLHARLETARRQSAENEALSVLAGQTMADLEQALGLISALLRLGQIETGQRKSHFTDVSLAGLLEETFELYQPLAEAKPVSLAIVCGPDAIVQGDRDMLMELCVNLTDNAIKFAPVGGSVRLELKESENGAVMRVADSGGGIAEAERGQVMKRFQRAARGDFAPGHGIGLSLVAAIARLHGFSIAMRDLEPGFAIDVTCPQ